jgi:hypothetical protein
MRIPHARLGHWLTSFVFVVFVLLPGQASALSIIDFYWFDFDGRVTGPVSVNSFSYGFSHPGGGFPDGGDVFLGVNNDKFTPIFFDIVANGRTFPSARLIQTSVPSLDQFILDFNTVRFDSVTFGGNPQLVRVGFTFDSATTRFVQTPEPNSGLLLLVGTILVAGFKSTNRRRRPILN